MPRSLAVWWAWLISDYRHFFPLAILLIYGLIISRIGKLGGDHAVVLAPVILYYLGPKARPGYRFLLPLFLTIIIYDSQRYFADAIRGVVHVSEPFEFDKFFFGIREGSEVLTPNQWFQRHTHPILDVITGFFYIAFVPLFVGIAAYFRFGPLKRTGFAAEADSLMWAFFWLNMIGYSTYYWYAASPPWYVEQYGLGPVRLDIAGSPAGCLRFDAALGTRIFSQWYGRAADVHGAIPSLHIAYPCLALVYAVRFRSLVAVSAVFFIVLCFSAVYLNHHYILDILWGTVYAAVVGKLMLVWNSERWRSKRGSLKRVA